MPTFSDIPTFRVPKLERGEALVKVHAVSLNGYDLMARAGRYKPNKGKFPHILGGDFGGELVALGPETPCDLPMGTRVTSWWILPCRRCEQCMAGHHNRCASDYRYLGAHEHGAYAQYVKLPADHLIPLPDSVTFRAGRGVSQRLRHGVAYADRSRQLARRRDGAGEFRELRREHGGDPDLQAGGRLRLHDVERGLETRARQGTRRRRSHQLQRNVDFVDEILKRTNKRGVDLVVEHVGGDFLEKSIRCLTRGGRVVTVGGTKSYDCKVPVNYIFHKELQIIGSNSATKHDLEVMMPLLGSGKLKTVIDRVFPLQEAVDAHRYLESAKQFGKVVLRVDH